MDTGSHRHPERIGHLHLLPMVSRTGIDDRNARCAPDAPPVAFGAGSCPAELAHALRMLATCSELALAAVKHDDAALALDLIRAVLAAARRLRALLSAAASQCLPEAASPTLSLTNELNLALARMLDVSDRLHWRYGDAYMEDVQLLSGVVGSPPCSSMMSRRPGSRAVNGAKCEYGVRAIREILAPINELHVTMDLLARKAKGAPNVDLPF